MPDRQVEGSIRRLAAVWFADIVGYTRMSASDEDTALALVSILQEVARAEVAAQGGRIVKFIGDAVLAEFQSTEASVRAALALNAQYEVASANAGHPSKLRVGVHVGDVLGTPDGDLYGDGINTASRVQGAAEPGHCWVTKDVWSQLHARRDFRFATVGENALKGLDAKLSIYSVTMAGKEPAVAEKKPAAPSRRQAARYARLVRVALVYVVIAGVLVVGTGVLRNTLQLAEWVMPGGVLILLMGLVVTLATEWAQSAPGPARFPALTWGRALMGGVFMYTLLFVAAGVYQIAQGDDGLAGGPQPGAASAVPSAPDGQGDLTADVSPVTEQAPGPTADGTPQPTTPSAAAPESRDDAPRLAYESARGTTETARRAAATAGASASMEVFARAESMRSQAATEAQQGRLDDARRTINQARGLYDEARNNAVLENRIDSLLSALGSLQSAARLSAGDAAQVQELTRQASEAQRVARYPDAIRLLQQVEGVYRDAAAAQGRASAPTTQPSAPANDVRPQAPPPSTPTIAAGPVRSNEEIAAEVVEEMRSAIERKDIAALEAVWNLSDTQRRGFQQSWAIMQDLRVSTSTQSVEASGGQITVSITTVYQFTNQTTRRVDRTQNAQTLTLAQQNGRWRIVSTGR
jgi:class 3 adenylate cyclase